MSPPTRYTVLCRRTIRHSPSRHPTLPIHPTRRARRRPTTWCAPTTRPTYGLQTTLSNCSNNYGPYQFPEKLIPLCVVNLLEGKELPIYGDGANVRDWLHVADHCRGIDRVLERGAAGETYNLGADSERTNLELVRLLCRILDRLFAESSDLATRFPKAPPANGKSSSSRITFVRDRPGHDRRYAIDASKARDALEFEAETDLESGLEATLRWYLEHEVWWRSIMDSSYRGWIESWYGDGHERSSS
jgi:dTDP-glucose 4,6-dehydratase